MAFTKRVFTVAQGACTVRVYRDPYTGEYRVRVWVDGSPRKAADYFTEDSVDALDTARAMLKANLAPTAPATSNIATLVANLRHAVRNGETVTIGGGVFGPDELREAADALQKTLDEGESKWT